MRFKSFIFFLLIAPICVFSQEIATVSAKDTMGYASTINLDEVVITGQYEPQSAQNSVYQVKIIDKERILSQGAASLDEVLSNELNIRLSQDLAIGNSSLSLQGISGNNVKILLDGIPVAGRNGNGNDVDLYQINLHNIEKIEIVEGSMAVNFGANTLAGVINIITHKQSHHKTSATASLQEETAGQEYGINRGKHIQNLSLSHNFSKKWFAQFNVAHNDFAGFQGDITGRQKEWNPKEQWIFGGLARFSLNDHDIYYKIDYLDENILSPGQIRYDINSSGERIPFAFDEKYLTRRIGHHLQSDGKFGGFRYNLAFAYSDFERIKSRYSKNLGSGSETLTTTEGDQDTSYFKAYMLRGSLVRAIGSKLSFQAGYDINLEKTGGGRISGRDRSIKNYGFYLTSEWLPTNWLKMRPGLRYALNSVYETPLLPSLNLKFDLNAKTYLRFAYGRGYRAPSIRELYFEFVDSNHRIFGNENLEPVYSHHFDGNLSRQLYVGNINLTSSFGGFYNDINNLIATSQSATDATSVSYVNVLKSKTVGFVFEQQYEAKKISGKIGFSYTGRYNRLSDSDTLSLKRFFFSPELNFILGYQFPKANLHLNLFYKYNGTLKSYFDSEDGNGIETGEQEGYHWLDLTASKKFGKHIIVNTGAKNLFNITKINTTASGGSAHASGNSVPVAYGRSYFMKISYNLNIN